MKKLVFTAVAMIALLSVSGCVGIGKGKGKARCCVACDTGGLSAFR